MKKQRFGQEKVDPVREIREVSQRALSARAVNVIMDEHLQIAHNISQIAATHDKKKEMHVSLHILIYRIFFPLYL